MIHPYDCKSIPKGVIEVHYTPDAINKRLAWARHVTNSELRHVSSSTLKPQLFAGNIENYIGTVQIPIGLAGPVLVKGQHAKGYIPVPMATTEGALVSSINRGAIATRLSGGIETYVKAQSMVRAPAFFFEDIGSSICFEKWLTENYSEIVKKAESASSIAKVKFIVPYILGKIVHVLFYYTTGDAAGQNMTSACTWIACEWIVKCLSDHTEMRLKKYIIEGNFSGDKKVNVQNFVNGRGVSITALCHISDKILKRIFRADAQSYIDCYDAAELGGLHTGMMGCNGNFANVIAGMFTATGQDIACVHESSLGILKLFKEDNGLTVMVVLPSLVIGTVGGGTGLPTQKECLELMGCYGSGKVYRFAEIIAATCLCLDLSTLGAIVSNEFVQSHERLGRNRPVRDLSPQELSPQFFSDMLHTKSNKIISCTPVPLLGDNSIISNAIESRASKIFGVHRYLLQVQSRNGLQELPVVLKIKTSDIEVIDLGAKVAKLSGEDTLPGFYVNQSNIFGFKDSHLREMAIYKLKNSVIQKYCPRIYGVKEIKEKQAFLILMEDLSTCALLNSVNRPEQWFPPAINVVLDGIAGIHAHFFHRFEELPSNLYIKKISSSDFSHAYELIAALKNYNTTRYPHLISTSLMRLFDDFLANHEERCAQMERYHITLTHNDFNTRNLCLRSNGKEQSLVVFDWELAMFQNPQLDILEFLAHVIPNDTSSETFFCYFEHYRSLMEWKTAIPLPADQFYRIAGFNLLYLLLVRYNLYLLAHNILKFQHIDRVYTNLVRFISFLEDFK